VGVEPGLERVARQVQGGQHQPDRFVPGVFGAVAKHRPASLKRLTAQRSQSRTVMQFVGGAIAVDHVTPARA
jgi:hypothetical protein